MGRRLFTVTIFLIEIDYFKSGFQRIKQFLESVFLMLGLGAVTINQLIDSFELHATQLMHKTEMQLLMDTSLDFDKASWNVITPEEEVNAPDNWWRFEF